MSEFAVEHSVLQDLDLIFQFFDASVAYQEKRRLPNWRNYDRAVIQRDVAVGNHYKGFCSGQIGIFFSVTYSDQVIWREREKGDSLYLHRIVVNPHAQRVEIVWRGARVGAAARQREGTSFCSS